MWTAMIEKADVMIKGFSILALEASYPCSVWANMGCLLTGKEITMKYSSDARRALSENPVGVLFHSMIASLRLDLDKESSNVCSQ